MPHPVGKKPFELPKDIQHYNLIIIGKITTIGFLVSYTVASLW